MCYTISLISLLKLDIVTIEFGLAICAAYLPLLHFTNFKQILIRSIYFIKNYLYLGYKKCFEEQKLDSQTMRFVVAGSSARLRSLEMAEKDSCYLAYGVPLSCHFVILFPCPNGRSDEPINSDTAVRVKMSLANSCLPGHRIIRGSTTIPARSFVIK